jgi:hypothetical protein
MASAPSVHKWLVAFGAKLNALSGASFRNFF